MERRFLGKFLFIVSGLFDSALENEKLMTIRMYKLIRLIVNIIYALSLAIPLGFLIQIILLMILPGIPGFEMAATINWAATPVLIFICLAGIAISNFEDESYSLPRNVLNFYVVMCAIKKGKSIRRTIVFIISITFALMFTLAWFMSSFIITEKYHAGILLIIAIISLFTAIVIHSETIKDEINRKKMQCIISLLLFLVFLILNIYQILQYISIGADNKTSMFAVITVLGLLFTMTTTIDKTRCLFNAVRESEQERINALWGVLNQKYSYKLGFKVVTDKKDETKQTVKTIKGKWRDGNRNDRIRIIAILSLFTLAQSCVLYLAFNPSKTINLTNYVFENVKAFWVNLFNENEEMVMVLLAIFVGIAAFIWLIRGEKKKLKDITML